jgi:hypothetical protein
VNILIPIDRRGFFTDNDVGKTIIKRRSTLIQLVNQYVDRVITERRYDMDLHVTILITPIVISNNLNSRKNKAI